MSISETARAELHYTSFESAGEFAELTRRHGLDYKGPTDHLGDATPFLWVSDTGTMLATGCHPITGEIHSGGYKREGYASYVKILGPPEAAESLYRDVVDTAQQIKGEFKPLSVGEEILVSLDELEEQGQGEQ